MTNFDARDARVTNFDARDARVTHFDARDASDARLMHQTCMALYCHIV